MVPSSPSCGSDSGLTSDQETIGPVSSPYQSFKIEPAELVATSIPTSKSWDYENLDVLDDLFKGEPNDENTSGLANQVKIEPNELTVVNTVATVDNHQPDDFLMNDIHEILYGNNSSAPSDIHDDSSTDLFPDLGCIDPLIASYWVLYRMFYYV